jgi:hypothetical protein
LIGFWSINPDIVDSKTSWLGSPSISPPCESNQQPGPLSSRTFDPPRNWSIYSCSNIVVHGKLVWELEWVGCRLSNVRYVLNVNRKARTFAWHLKGFDTVSKLILI